MVTNARSIFGAGVRFDVDSMNLLNKSLNSVINSSNPSIFMGSSNFSATFPGAQVPMGLGGLDKATFATDNMFSRTLDSIVSNFKNIIAKASSSSNKSPENSSPLSNTGANVGSNYNPSANSGASKGSIAEAGLSLIKKSEGCYLNAYTCPAGVWTIGYGHTGDASKGQKISKEQAESLLKSDMKEYENYVKKYVKVSLNQNQFDALVSFTYNCGPGALKDSTLLKKLNDGDYQGAANEFSRFVYGGGKKLPGLVTRREAEKQLFLT